jgi:hypothetical protein
LIRFLKRNEPSGGFGERFVCVRNRSQKLLKGGANPLVEVAKMRLGMQQSLVIVLAVEVDQCVAQRFQD